MVNQSTGGTTRRNLVLTQASNFQTFIPPKIFYSLLSKWRLISVLAVTILPLVRVQIRHVMPILVLLGFWFMSLLLTYLLSMQGYRLHLILCQPTPHSPPGKRRAAALAAVAPYLNPPPSKREGAILAAVAPHLTPLLKKGYFNCRGRIPSTPAAEEEGDRGIRRSRIPSIPTTEEEDDRHGRTPSVPTTEESRHTQSAPAIEEEGGHYTKLRRRYSILKY